MDYLSPPGFRGGCFDWFPTFFEGSFRNLSSRGVSFELGRWDAAERGVQALVVEPGDVLDDGELELRAAAPDAVADQLGLEACGVRKVGAVARIRALCRLKPRVSASGTTPVLSRLARPARLLSTAFHSGMAIDAAMTH
jgi:hypothetical protein